jgi:hypothetical protein
VNRMVPAHYIRRNEKANVPSRLVVLDTIPRRVRIGETESQSWWFGVVSFNHWTRHGRLIQEYRKYTDAGLMWKEIGEFTRPKRRTILYSHNLPYDLRIADGLRHLSSLAFKLESIRLANQGAWSRWTRDKASLTLCDSSSIFPVQLSRLESLLGSHRIAPTDTDDIDIWGDYCAVGVQHLTDILRQYFDWLKTGVAGNWQLTGAGQSWAHWRHSHYTHPVLVHPDDEAIKAERRAMWTGRAENWSWGKDLDAPVYEWDWANSYPRIGRDYDVPVRLVGTARTANATELPRLAERYTILADVTIRTEQPVVPTRRDGRILWPVGEFKSTLWWPEIEAVLSEGGTVTPHCVWLYRSEPALQEWGTWIINQVHGKGAIAYPWVPLVLKHWSRTLIGRFATQYQNWEEFGTERDSKVQVGKLFDVDTGLMTDVMQVGHDLHIMTGLSESDDSCPQITSYIMSVARRRLWDALQAVGSENVLYMDTDSLIVNMEGHVILTELTKLGQFNGLRLKDRHRGYEIYGPRSAIIGSRRVFAGMPKAAVRTGEKTFQGEVWTNLEKSLSIGEADRVTIQPRTFTVRYNDNRRQRAEGGRTVPHRLGPEA